MNRRDELYHYGVPGMRWGKRRVKADYQTDPNNSNGPQPKKRSKLKTALKVGAGLAVAAGAAYGAKKLYDARRKKQLLSMNNHNNRIYELNSIAAERIKQLRNPNTISRATDTFYKNKGRQTEVGKKMYNDFYNMTAKRKAKYKTSRFRDSVNDFYYSVARKRR